MLAPLSRSDGSSGGGGSGGGGVGGSAGGSDGSLDLLNLNQLYKLEPSTLGLWCGVLRAAPRARLWLLQPASEAGSEKRATGLATGLDYPPRPCASPPRLAPAPCPRASPRTWQGGAGPGRLWPGLRPWFRPTQQRGLPVRCSRGIGLSLAPLENSSPRSFPACSEGCHALADSGRRRDRASEQGGRVRRGGGQAAAFRSGCG